MYVAEAELLVMPRAESFLGHYGVVITQPETYHMDGSRDGLTTEPIVAPTEWALNLKLAGRQIAGKKLPHRDVEHITSLEQAEKYVLPVERTHQIMCSEAEEVIDSFRQYPGSQDAEIMTGSANVWRERRIPSRYLYAASFGELVCGFAYDSETQGWLLNQYPADVKRRRIGLMIPGHVLCFTSVKVVLTPEELSPIKPADPGIDNIPFCG